MQAEDESRNIGFSKTLQTVLLMPAHMNGANVLFGGQLMSWIDAIAGVAAMRHSDSNVVTAVVDSLEFKNSAKAGDVITLEAMVTWVGNSSMEVRVRTYKENHDVKYCLINTAYLVLVALDENKKPRRVPRLIAETEEDKLELAAGEKRAAARKMRKNSQ